MFRFDTLVGFCQLATVVTEPMSEKRRRILDAALVRVSRYGFRRTSMEDIAGEAGISRAALYLDFRNKDEIFRTAAATLQDESLRRAEAEAAGERPLADRLIAVIEAKSLAFVELAFSSPHGGEILDETNRLCGDIVADAQRRFASLLTRLFTEGARRGEVDPKRVGLTPAGAADLLLKSLRGLKGSGRGVAEYRADAAALVRLFLSGMGASAGQRTAAPARGRSARVSARR